MKALIISLVFFASASPEPSLSRYEVRTLGSSNGAVCASLYAYTEANTIGRDSREYLGRDACFDTRRQCEQWFYAAQTYYRDVEVRRPCR